MSKSADAFRTISEVAEWLGVQSHVLRFWESKFPQVKPVKRAGGRRYYRPTDMLLLGGIRKLLHDDGLTVKGVQKILREEGVAHVSDLSRPLDDDTSATLDGSLITHAPGPSETAPAPDAGMADDAAADDDGYADFDNDDMPDGIDHAPIRIESDGPDSQDNDNQEQTTPANVPAFMRNRDMDAAVYDDTDRDADVPELTSDYSSDTEPTAPPPAHFEDPAPADEGPELVDTPDSVSARDEAPQEPTAQEPAIEEPALEDDAAPLFQHFAPEADANAASEALQNAATAAPEQIASAPPTDVPDTVEDPAPQPRPRIIDVPDDANIDEADIAPSVLTKTAQLSSLTPQQRDTLRPLVAQLTALRDQMARARGDHG